MQSHVALNDSDIANAVARLDQWLSSMRHPAGYSGPISHWWESSLLYCGPMMDWRYEGIITGYLTLYDRTRQKVWLEHARRAGYDLLAAQLPNGNFRNSAFQQGPMEAGTPHEAAVAVALLSLAQVLQQQSESDWHRFFAAAERNLYGFHLEQLWDGTTFRDQAWNHHHVPNKNATTLEALLLYQTLSGQSMEHYIRGAAALVLSAQVTIPGPRYGATVHLGTGRHALAIGIYTARCAAALYQLYRHDRNDQYRWAALKMVQFLQRSLTEAGVVFGFYPDGRAIQTPTWISAAGDVLRALWLWREESNNETAISRLATLLCTHQQPGGGIPTAVGIGRKGGTDRPPRVPDFRDVLPVVGWVDKAFRALTLLAPPAIAAPISGQTDSDCTWKGKPCRYQEDETAIHLIESYSQKVLFHWSKGSCYPQIYCL